MIFCLLVSPALAESKQGSKEPAKESTAKKAEAIDEEGSPELTEEASKAIDSGLDFLLKSQNKDGSWANKSSFTIACTSLGLMAFMVKGEFPGYGPNADALNKAKNFLLKRAKSAADGYLGKSMYEHGLATLALSELWGMTKDDNDDKEIQRALEAAVKVILRSQNVGGGWRYQPSPDSGQDTSVTVMVFIALASARQAGVMVPNESIKRVISYLEGAQDMSTGGFSYAPTGKGVSNPCTGGGLYVAQLCGERDSEMVKAALRYMMNWNDNMFTHASHFYYMHYYAIQAIVQTGDAEYAEWYPKIRDGLLGKQAKNGAWSGGAGGGVQSTAMAIIILGTPHRFIPIYQR